MGSSLKKYFSPLYELRGCERCINIRNVKITVKIWWSKSPAISRCCYRPPLGSGVRGSLSVIAFHSASSYIHRWHSAIRPLYLSRRAWLLIKPLDWRTYTVIRWYSGITLLPYIKVHFLLSAMNQSGDVGAMVIKTERWLSCQSSLKAYSPCLLVVRWTF